MHEQKIYLIDIDKGFPTLLPVLSDPVHDGIKYNEHTDSTQLLSKFKDVIAYHGVIGIHIRLFCKRIEGASGEELEFKCQVMRLLFRLPQKYISEIIQSWGRSHEVTLLVVAIHDLSAAVNDRLLASGELMPRYDLLTERLQELRLLRYRICLTIFL